MARLADRLGENAPGDFYVDASCIDCDTCREIAPAVFAASPRRAASHVRVQPRTPEEHRRACMALVSCPTASIGTTSRPRLREAIAALPEPVPGLDGVYSCGFASADSYGASSYLIRRPAGNVLVDSPRAARPLLENIAALGGVAQMFLTHRDDVADHAVFARRFGCARILHAADVGPGTREVELQPSGPLRLAPDLLVIPVPGHTRGSAALLYRDEVLFSGDHLWADGGALDASRAVCWHSWPEQRRSLRLLLEHPFRAVLPGHGGRFVAPTVDAAHAALRALLARLG
jgi:glyoxylase-like metal-dependent hydrolase (beta-lactamase superfamily II)/ferredoxin